MKPRIIAFYLPQFHPFKENDEWWGKGFTEWTNVAKAKPLFPGHQQPKIPADLGFYDLRLPQVREEQTKLAKEAGVYGFCYYHYWFGDKELMSLPFDEVVKSGKPDFPFCLCWANESWHAKFWNADGTTKKKLLIEQKYLGKEDNEKHFYRLLDAFKDKRYIRVNGRLLFCIYKPLEFKDLENFIDQWNNLAKQNGLEGFYFVGQTIKKEDTETILARGIDAVNLIRLYTKMQSKNIFRRVHRFMRRFIKFGPFVYHYKSMIPLLDGVEDEREDVIPTLIPNWDHTPRSKNGGMMYQGCTPQLWYKHIKRVFQRVKGKRNKLVFLKSWNEWGEGNYMEPDLIYGRQYIETLHKALEEEK